MPQPPNVYRLKTIKRNLYIIPSDNTSDDALNIIIHRFNFERLKRISIQLGAERKRVRLKLESGKTLSERENAFTDTNRVVRICKAEYYKDIRQYALFFTALNFLEDAIRCAVNEIYYAKDRRDDWHKDITLWPQWYYERVSDDQDKLARILRVRYAANFLENLDFGVLLGFLTSDTAWSSTNVPSLFASKKNISGASLPFLSQDELNKRLSIIQKFRNIIYHHNIVPNPLRFRIDGHDISIEATPNKILKNILDMLEYFDVNASNLIKELSDRENEGYLTDQ
ncbi:hypothetical protein DESA109040_13620 [Deinococcus saxicola]|uniref:hypothetical protein n=1 Tax=Deinococcus saxicola TaxID=249406 RepID=UPI0039EE4297